MFNFLKELIEDLNFVDNLISILSAPYHWRVFVSVVVGFSIMFSLSHFISKEEAERHIPLIILGCLVIPGIIGLLWHKVAHRNEEDS